MSEHERGAYTPPTEASLSFDARQPVRGASPIPFTLIISILVLLGLAAAIFVFYRSGVRQAGQPPQAVGAPVEGMKAPPPVGAQPRAPTTPAPAKPASAAPAPVAKAAGVAAVQIGAFSSQALADKGWSDAAAIAPAAGKGKSVEKVEKDGHTLFRTQVTGFTSRVDATAFCGKLKAAGKACF